MKIMLLNTHSAHAYGFVNEKSAIRTNHQPRYTNQHNNRTNINLNQPANNLTPVFNERIEQNRAIIISYVVREERIDSCSLRINNKHGPSAAIIAQENNRIGNSCIIGILDLGLLSNISIDSNACNTVKLS
jgi:hypothetical protein